MEALTAYSSSDEEGDRLQKSEEIDPKESAKTVSRLKEKFPLNSAPTVLGKVGINWKFIPLLTPPSHTTVGD